MTPREPDRFEEKARELMDSDCPHEASDEIPCVICLAAALRAAESSALERAEAAFREWSNTTYDTRDVFQVLIGVRTAIASPAAAPAAEDGAVWVMCSTDTDEHHGAHRLRHPTRDEKSWCLDPIPVAAPPSEPVAPARNVRDADSISLLQWKARARSAEARAENQEANWRSHMATLLTTIGGEVEGAPTADYNFLQRLRELTAKEALLAKLQASRAALADGGEG